MLVAAFAANSLHAMILVGGTGPVQERHDWPQGSADVANLAGRRGWHEGPPFGGGQYRFEYVTTDTRSFNHALMVFSRINAPRLELYVYDGPRTSFMLREGESDARTTDGSPRLRYDWGFEVWAARSWHSLNNRPDRHFPGTKAGPIPPPRIELFIGGGGVDWDQVEIPPNISLVDYRAATVAPMGWNCNEYAGCVYDMETQQPVVDALLTLVTYQEGQFTTVTTTLANSKGDFRFPDLTTGSYYLRAEAPGYATRYPEPRHLPDCAGPVALYLAKTAEVTGFAETSDGKRVPGIVMSTLEVLGIDGEIYFTGINRGQAVRVAANENGEFSFSGLPRGYVLLSAFQGRLSGNRLHWIETPAKDVRVTFPIPGAIEVLFKMDDATTDSRSKPAGRREGKWLHVLPTLNERGYHVQETEIRSLQPVQLPHVLPGDYHVGIGPRFRPDSLDGFQFVTVAPETTATVTIKLSREHLEQMARDERVSNVQRRF